jgi:hypothetical protein
MKIWIFSLWKQTLCKVFMEFIVLLYTIKCWYNTPLQVLTAAPALHSLIVRGRDDVTDILEILFHIRGYLRKLILQSCRLGWRSTGLLASIVTLYPDLEVLSLGPCSLTSDDYCLIARLKKLSELNLSYCKVHYIKLLETCVCVREARSRTPLAIHIIYLGKKEIYWF